jgi:hypothetical protein
VDEQIRTRAYFKWLSRPDHGRASAFDDWLAAEEEELAISLAATANAASADSAFTYTQDDLWFGSTQLADLFGLLRPTLRRRRAQSRLLAMIEEYQDYLTSSSTVSDTEAVRIGGHALRIWRLLSSLGILIGDDLSLTQSNSVRKELKDIFSESLIAFQTSEFNLYSAASIRLYTGLEVFFIDEGKEASPDLEVRNLAYVECKDVQSTSRDNLGMALEDNLGKALRQLHEAQESRRLPGTGICIDLPIGSLPLANSEWEVIRHILSSSEGPDFVWISSSGLVATKTHVGSPVATCLVWRQSGEHLFHSLLRYLGRSSFKMHSDHFEHIFHPPEPLVNPVNDRSTGE